MRPKICTSVFDEDGNELVKKVREAIVLNSDFVEIRIDYLRDYEPIDELIEFSDKLVLTCRSKEEGGVFKDNEEVRKRIIVNWVSRIKPSFVDIELSSLREDNELLKKLKGYKTTVIASWHDFKVIPGIDLLERIANYALKVANIAKIVVMAKNFEDNLSILSLYKRVERGRLISFCMGEQGRISRILSGFLAPFTYASLPKLSAAPGQIDILTLREIYNAITA
jgi:3-dehydroquinate dehydratase-1